jgi:hypothetical protein
MDPEKAESLPNIIPAKDIPAQVLTRVPESSYFNTFWTPASAGVTIGRYIKSRAGSQFLGLRPT